MTFPDAVVPDPAPAVNACTGGGAAALAAQTFPASPSLISATAAQRLHQAEQYLRIIEQLNSASQSLEKAWSGAASESAVQKITSSIGSFIRIVEAIQAGAALLHISSGLISSAQHGYNAVMHSVNPTVASLMSNPWTYGAAEALATGSVASLSTWITAIQAALHITGAGKMMQQVTILMAIISDIERLSQSGGNAASDASAMISLYRAGKQEYNIVGPSPAAGAFSQPQGISADPDVGYA